MAWRYSTGWGRFLPGPETAAWEGSTALFVRSRIESPAGAAQRVFVVVYSWNKSMTETEFLSAVEQVWREIEARVDEWANRGYDIEVMRNGPVLELEFESGKKIVVNSQAPMKQIWLASPHGAFHYEWEEGAWRDTRSGKAFWQELENQATLLAA
jgi:CyaY protein